MGTLSESKFSKKGGVINHGDRIGIAFHHGILEHPKYGKITEASVVIPLLLPYGEFPIPTIINEDDRMDLFVKKLKKEYAYLWEEELDEEIEARLKDYATIVAFLVPFKEDILTPRMQSLVMSVIVGFAFDDLLDQIDNLEDIGITYKDQKAKEVIEKILYSSSEDAENIPVGAPQFAPYIKFFVKFNASNRKYIKNFIERGKAVRRETNNLMTSFALIMENNREGADGLSEETLLNLNGYQSGFLSGLEYFALYEESDVKDEIRGDVLFQRFGNCLANVCTLMNAIFGLGRDMMLNQVDDSPILRQVVYKGKTFQEGFNTVLEQIYNALQDIRIGGQKLKERYADIPAVVNYIKLAEHLSDGQFYAYMHIRRYGALNLQIQKI